MEKDIYRSQFRMPQSLYEALKAAADKKNRSVNAELVARLQESFDVGTSFSTPVIVQNFDDLMNEFMRRYNISMQSPVALKPQPEFPDQADDMPMDPPKRRIKLNRGKT